MFAKLSVPCDMDIYFSVIGPSLVVISHFYHEWPCLPTNDPVLSSMPIRNHHSLAFQPPLARTDIYKFSFSSYYKRLEVLDKPLIYASEGEEDSVTKFTSLLRARDKLS